MIDVAVAEAMLEIERRVAIDLHHQVLALEEGPVRRMLRATAEVTKRRGHSLESLIQRSRCGTLEP